MKTKLLISTLGLSFVLATPLMAATTGTIQQTGNSNSAVVTQYDNADAVTLLQVNGNGNITNVAQADNMDASAEMLVYGSNNSLHIVQTDNPGKVEGDINVFGYGSGNLGGINTSGVIDGTATITFSSAHSNQAFITQAEGANGNPSKNLNADITQYNGWYNVASIYQHGANHDASILQVGNNNTAGIDQRRRGGLNTADISQNGHHNIAYISQRGSNLTGTLTQNGNSNYATLAQR